MTLTARRAARPRLAGDERGAEAAEFRRRLGFFCVLVLSGGVVLVQAPEDGQWAFWGGMFLVFGVLLNWVGLRRTRRDVFEPVVLVGAMFVLEFAARALILRFELDPARVNAWVSSNMHLLGRMSLYAAGGLALFLLGYYCPLGPAVAGRLPRVTTTWDMQRIGSVGLRLYCFALPAKLLAILPPGTLAFQETLMAYLGNIVGLIAALGDVALLLCGIQYYHYRKSGLIRGRRSFYCLLGAQVFVGFLTGYREPVFVSLLAVAFVRHYVWKPLRAPVLLGGFLIVMIVLTPISRAYRRVLWEERVAPLRAVGRLPEEVTSQVRNRPGPGGWSAGRYGLVSLLDVSNRFHGADSLITCLATVPHFMPYQMGKTLYLLPLSIFVPRALWPEKPKIGLGTFFRDNIWKGPLADSASGGQIAITQMGELYVNFGAWGILIGMAVLGAFHRFAYAYAVQGHERGNYNVLLMYFAAVLCFLAVERNLAFAYGYFFKMLLFLYVLCRCLNRGPVFSGLRRRGAEVGGGVGCRRR